MLLVITIILVAIIVLTQEGSLLPGRNNTSPALQRWYETWGLHLQEHEQTYRATNRARGY